MLVGWVYLRKRDSTVAAVLCRPKKTKVFLICEYACSIRNAEAQVPLVTVNAAKPSDSSVVCIMTVAISGKQTNSFIWLFLWRKNGGGYQVQSPDGTRTCSYLKLPVLAKNTRRNLYLRDRECPHSK